MERRSPVVSLNVTFDVEELKEDNLMILLEIRENDVLSEVEKTEIRAKLSDISFSTPLRLQFKFEALQQLVFKLCNVGNEFYDAPEDVIAETNLTIPLILSHKDGITRSMISSDTSAKVGDILIEYADISGSVGNVEMMVECELRKGLTKRITASKREIMPGKFQKVFQSPVIPKNLRPIWRKVEFTMPRESKSGVPVILKFLVFNYKSKNKQSLIGEAKIEASDIKSGGYLVITKEDDKSEDGKEKGMLYFESFKLAYSPTFIDYITHGCEINLLVAIDFTLSNGNPLSRRSRHHICDENCYIKAIKAVTGVLGEYDSDDLYPVFGFGAKLKSQPSVSHCFPLSLTELDVEVKGVDGIVEMYKSTLKTIQLAGPTLFAPVIRKAAEYASIRIGQSKQRYFILLIITDGQITDLDAAAEAIISASSLPLSIVIVGLGIDDFSLMDYLDSDTRALRSRTQADVLAERDIVQFVPYTKYESDMSVLVKATLEEMPEQLVSYMTSKNIYPAMD